MRYGREFGAAGKSLVLGSFVLAALGWVVEPARWALLILAVALATAAGFGAWRENAHALDRLNLELEAADARISRLRAYPRALPVLGHALPMLIQASVALTRVVRQPLPGEAPATDEQIESAVRGWLRVFEEVWPALEGCGPLVTDPVQGILHGPGPSDDPATARHEAEGIVQALEDLQREAMTGLHA